MWHCRLSLDELFCLCLKCGLFFFQIFLTNLSQVNPTVMNKSSVMETTQLGHRDVFTIIDRSFRFEFFPEPGRSPGKHTPSKVFTPKVR